MSNQPLFTKSLYLKKIFNTFFPRFLHSLSPRKKWMRKHWKEQEEGGLHGYDQYTTPHERIPILISEINRLVGKESSILDLGCNCGLYLKYLKDDGFTSLAGIDISEPAIEYGKTTLGLGDISLIAGSFEDVLPGIASEHKQYDLVYSMGATIELVHPSFDIIGSICRISKKYVVLIISEWGHAYPRFYEYEFNRQGFLLVKAVRPYDGKPVKADYLSINSFLVFQKVIRV